MNMVKAISLWQPWALLCVLGLKQYETRSWATPFRGTLVMHAAKRWTREEQRYVEYFLENFVTDPDARKLMFKLMTKDPAKPNPYLGAALGTVELTAIYRTEPLRSKLSGDELAFGNYQDGRFAWRLENPVLFPEPIPYRGEQGMWTWQLPLPESAAS